jgi:Zn-dependent metalloprotease
MKLARLLTACLLFSGTAPSYAVRPGPGAKDDAHRFGFDRVEPLRSAAPAAAAAAAFAGFNAAHGARWTIRYDARTGLPTAVVGGRDFPRGGRAEDAAKAFLAENRNLLGVDPASLNLERQTHSSAQKHLLYRQTYRGLPVEFSAVKVHVDADGAVSGVHSSYVPLSDVPMTPSVSALAAAASAQADAGGALRGEAALVIVPLPTDARGHLAWKMRIEGRGGAWRYYVDAVTGQVLLRTSIFRYACATSGNVAGMVYDIDPSTTPGPVSRPFNNQYVYVPASATSQTQVLTGGDLVNGQGYFCSQTAGKVDMSLQGPWVNVGEFRGGGAHFDNGGGTWQSLAASASSPHPYANATVSVSTLDLNGTAPNFTMELSPVFTNFSVGGFFGGSSEGGGDISDDDQLFIYDGGDNPVASYIGARGGFNGASVHGRAMHLALRANASGTSNGFDVASARALVLTNAPGVDGGATSNHTWVPADSAVGLRSEMNLFYHINQMHDYYFSDVNRSSAAPVTKPVTVMAHVGPDLQNAFYDPDYDDLYFGDVSAASPQDLFTDDATVPHHEYTHYIIEKIWSIQNYGQAGAISEGLADYFAASSLNHPAIGAYVTGGAPLRQLDCPITTNSCYYTLNTTPPQFHSWTGEIHDDSPFFSQALWDIRRDRISALGPALGRSCADGLVFQSLLYFPESFSEFYDALKQVDAQNLVASCGGSSPSIITAAFNAHGILPAGGDGYEPNNGFETAVDISTLSAVSATIYPATDADFYTFGAGPGLVNITLGLPADSNYPNEYFAYQLKLFNASRQLVAASAPAYNGFGTLDGICDVSTCRTTNPSVTLSYNNPTGGLLYVEVIGGDSVNGSNSAVNSGVPYGLAVNFPHASALSGGIVTAKFDNDVISFTVNTSTFVSNQDWKFTSAQLRDQSEEALAHTLTHLSALSTDFLTFVSSRSAAGLMTGQVQLVPGFAARFPSVGTVYLEVFATDVHGTLASMGLSNPINLSANQPALVAYNNIVNPRLAQKATVRYAVNAAGHVTLKLYTITGRLVTTLLDQDVSAGKGSLDWDGHNSNGGVVASGVYVVRAEGPGLRSTVKIAVVK